MFNYEIENNEYDNLEECVNEVYELASKYAIDGVKNNIGGPFGAGIIYEKRKWQIYYSANRKKYSNCIKRSDCTCRSKCN